MSLEKYIKTFILNEKVHNQYITNDGRPIYFDIKFSKEESDGLSGFPPESNLMDLYAYLNKEEVGKISKNVGQLLIMWIPIKNRDDYNDYIKARIQNDPGATVEDIEYYKGLLKRYGNKPESHSDVHEKYRRLGIASAMYKKANDILRGYGMKLHASELQSDDAKSLWSSLSKKGFTKHKSGRIKFK